MTCLEDEFSRAVCNITPERLAALRAAGVPDAVFAKHMVGAAQIEAHRGGLFEVVDEGTEAVLLPVGEWDGLNWILEDLVAFHLDRPGRWWRRFGVADVLGDVASFTIEPKKVYATPLDWLKEAGHGLVVLDWSQDPINLLMGAGLIGADRTLLNKLRRAAVKAAGARVNRIFCNA